MNRISGKARLLAVALLATAACSLAAQELDSGKVRLILHEGIGRFSLYTRRSPAAAELIPLFVDQDPRTSGVSLVVDNRIYKLGSSAEFTESVEYSADPATARFRWTSRSLEVVQEFTPVSSSPQAQPEGVRMSIRISNRSRNRQSVGLRLCLDTYLGEENLSHFSSDRHQEIRSELTVEADEMIRYWVSPSADAPQAVGLLCMTSGSDITPPDRIVFANWKRLNEASWYYETSSSRNFNLMPYSINDSAVCMYYDPVSIPALASREIVLVLANLTLTGYGEGVQVAAAEAAPVTPEAPPEIPAETPPAVPEEAPPAVPEEPPAEQPAEPPATAAPPENLEALLEYTLSEDGSNEQHLAQLNSLIERINERLASGQQISAEELRLMEEILSVIKDKAERYSGGR
ncbi:MAG: hypothetical protein JXB06_01530 [Spirochaetales bacterium]|nr:hypothetical protein [Spirochaetales bacterium]